MKGPTPDELSLHNQTNIYETPKKFKKNKIENDKKSNLIFFFFIFYFIIYIYTFSSSFY